MKKLFINREQANRHLDVLDEPGTKHIFAVIREAAWSPHREGYTKHLYGTSYEVLDALDAAQQEGCGVYVTMNAMSGQQRRKSDVTRVRAVWCERDETGQPMPLKSSLRIRTSPGRGHDILLCDPADPPSPTEAEAINRVIVAEYNGDKNAKDTARVLRLAGSWHLKREPHLVEIIGGNGKYYSRDELLAAFPYTTAQAHRPNTQPSLTHYVAGAIYRLREELKNAPEGERNSTLNYASYRLAQLGLSVEEISEHLESTAIEIGLSEIETQRTIASGVAGAEKWREGGER